MSVPPTSIPSEPTTTFSSTQSQNVPIKKLMLIIHILGISTIKQWSSYQNFSVSTTGELNDVYRLMHVTLAAPEELGYEEQLDQVLDRGRNLFIQLNHELSHQT